MVKIIIKIIVKEIGLDNIVIRQTSKGVIRVRGLHFLVAAEGVAEASTTTIVAVA